MRIVQPLPLVEHLLHQQKSGKKAALLGLDVGTKFVGLAMSDPSNKLAIPHGVLRRTEKNIDSVASDLQRLISDSSLVGFVVGYPHHPRNILDADLYDSDDGFPPEAVLMVQRFIADLTLTRKLDDVMYTYWDERCSTKSARNSIEPLGLRGVQKKKILDKFAATNILQWYLNFVNEKAGK